MLRGNANYSLTSLEQNSLKKYTSEQIAEKIYNLGESNPLKWNQIMHAIITILLGGASVLMTIITIDGKKRPRHYDPDFLKEGLPFLHKFFYILLALSLFGDIRMHFYKKSWKRKRRAFLNKLTKSREILNKLLLNKLTLKKLI